MGYANHFYISNRSVRDAVYLEYAQIDLFPDDNHAGQILDIIAYEWADKNANAQAETDELTLLKTAFMELNGTEDGTYNIAMRCLLKKDMHLLLAVEHISDQSESLINPLMFSNKYDYHAMSKSFDSLAIKMNDQNLNRFSGFSFNEDSDAPTYRPFTRLGFRPATVCIRAIISEPPLIHTSINSVIEFKEMHVYPNPAHHELTIDPMSDSKDEIIYLNIFDVTGQLVLQHKEISEEKQIRLNIKHLSTGTYLLQLKSKRGSQSFQFIKG